MSHRLASDREVAAKTVPTRDRREFLTEVGAGWSATVLAGTSAFAGSAGPSSPAPAAEAGDAAAEAIDFRYAPVMQQAALCLPDDPHKSLIGERGDLRYHYPVGSWSVAEFGEVVEFGLSGMQGERVLSQGLEAPGVPIVTTWLERDSASLELTAFATNRPGEGRVDNVILSVHARTEAPVEALPLVVLHTRREVTVEAGGVRVGPEGSSPFLLASAPLRLQDARGWSYLIELPRARVQTEAPRRYLLRFPQEGQGTDRVRAEATDAAPLLEEARRFWQSWRAFGTGVSWSLPGRSGEFLTACARNILQAREVRDGSLTFQVGADLLPRALDRRRPLHPRGRPLPGSRGRGAAGARDDVGAPASGRRALRGAVADEHWKDTGIALFSLVRQAELAQDWTYFERMQSAGPEGGRVPGRAARAGPARRNRLRPLRPARARVRRRRPGWRRPRRVHEHALGAGRAQGRGRAQRSASRRAGLAAAGRLYEDLRSACFAAMRQEMRRHPAGSTTCRC